MSYHVLNKIWLIFQMSFGQLLYMYLPTPPHRQDVTQGQFLIGLTSISLLQDWLPN